MSTSYLIIDAGKNYCKGMRKRAKKKEGYSYNFSTKELLLQQSNCLHLLNKEKRNAKIPSHET